MACNGNNHGQSCQCGWGGVFYGLGLTTEKSLWQRKESYTNPNAKCPRCRASVYFYQSPYGGKVFFDAMGPPWPKHPCTDSLNSPINDHEIKGLSRTIGLKDVNRHQPLVALEPEWFHIFCSNIQTVDSDPAVTVFFLGDQGQEKQLFSRIRRDQVDVLWPILLKRSVDRKYYEISTLKAKELVPSELRSTAFLSVSELMNFESALRLRNEISSTKELLPNFKPSIASKPAVVPKSTFERPKLTIDAIKQRIKLEEEKRLKEEAAKSAEKATIKTKESEDFIKNSGISLKKKLKKKLTKSQLREKKQRQRDLEKERALNVDRGPIKTALELAFENANKKTS